MSNTHPTLPHVLSLTLSHILSHSPYFFFSFFKYERRRIKPFSHEFVIDHLSINGSSLSFYDDDEAAPEG